MRLEDVEEGPIYIVGIAAYDWNYQYEAISIKFAASWRQQQQQPQQQQQQKEPQE